MYFILTKKKLRIFVPGYKLKQSACPDMKLSDSFVFYLPGNRRIYATVTDSFYLRSFFYLFFGRHYH